MYRPSHIGHANDDKVCALMLTGSFWQIAVLQQECRDILTSQVLGYGYSFLLMPLIVHYTYLGDEMLMLQKNTQSFLAELMILDVLLPFHFKLQILRQQIIPFLTNQGYLTEIKRVQILQYLDGYL